MFDLEGIKENRIELNNRILSNGDLPKPDFPVSMLNGELPKPFNYRESKLNGELPKP